MNKREMSLQVKRLVIKHEHYPTPLSMVPSAEQLSEGIGILLFTFTLELALTNLTHLLQA